MRALDRDNQLIFLDAFAVDEPKTSAMRAALDILTGGKSALVLLADVDETIQRGIRNLPDAMYLRANYLNIRDLLKYDKVIVTLGALDVIQTIWGSEE